MAAARVALVTDGDKPKSAYGKVALSLENCILPPEKTNPTPSLLDGLDRETEFELRILGCELIQTSGILLRLPQVAMATGQVLFQRFYYSKSFVRHSMEVVSMACVTLASKIEESPRRIRDVVNVFHHIKQVRSGKTIQPLILDQNYINLKNQVIKAERRVLKELGFCVHVKHPHKIIVTLLEVLKVKNHRIMQTSWNYMNDSLRSEVFIRYHPETVACACIYLSARLLQIPLPSKPAWFLIFGVSEKDINDICRIILSLYSKKKPDPDKLEKIVEELKKSHLEAKLKAKGGLNLSPHITNDHQRFSPSSLPGSPKNGKSPLTDFKKEKEVFKNGDVYLKMSRDGAHRRKKSQSPTNESPEKRNRSSSPQSMSSCSPSPRRKQKTPPRGYQDIHRSRSRSRSRSKSRDVRKAKHHASFYKKKGYSSSLSPHSSPHRHSSRKSYKPKSNEKKHKSRSRSHERNHHSSSTHEKSHKSHKEKLKTSHLNKAYIRR